MNDPSTLDVLGVTGITARQGSVIVDAVATFPDNSSTTGDTVMTVLNGDVNEGEEFTDGQTTLDITNDTVAFGKYTSPQAWLLDSWMC